MNKEIVIIGGGLAGLCSAIALSQKGLRVIVIEKSSYPKHKVCGEYVANEVLPFLNSLGFDPFYFGAKRIDKFLLSTSKGKILTSNLHSGGFGLSRYTFDAALAKLAREKEVLIINDTVSNVQFQNDHFTIRTKSGHNYKSNIVIGAYGKRSSLDKSFNRKFITKSSPYLAVKAHFKGKFPEDVVALHNFKGGYCGISKVENDHINVCYIADYNAFKKYKNIDSFQKEVLYENPHLKRFFENAFSIFDKPLTISQINFSTKKLIEDHVLMCGDSAGMIHPLCGNGMSMAIQSAQIVSSLLNSYFSGEIISRNELEVHYKKRWNQEFKTRLKTGKLLANLFDHDAVANLLMSGMRFVPNLVPKIIQRTHGKPLIMA